MMEASQNVRNLLTGTITNAPHIPRGAAFLDSGDMIRNPVHVFEKYRARLGPTFTFHFGGAQGAIVSTEPDFIQHVLQKNQTNYKKSDIQVKRMGEFQGQGLLNSHGQHWLRQRRFVAQSFLRDRLAKRVPAQRRVLEQSMSHFVRQVEHGPVDVYQQMVRFTLRIVGGPDRPIVGSIRIVENIQLQLANPQRELFRNGYVPVFQRLRKLWPAGRERREILWRHPQLVAVVAAEDLNVVESQPTLYVRSRGRFPRSRSFSADGRQQQPRLQCEGHQANSAAGHCRAPRQSPTRSATARFAITLTR